MDSEVFPCSLSVCHFVLCLFSQSLLYKSTILQSGGTERINDIDKSV